MTSVGNSNLPIGNQDVTVPNVRRLTNGQVITSENDINPAHRPDKFGQVDEARLTIEEQRNRSVPPFRFLQRKLPDPGTLYETGNPYKSNFKYNDQVLYTIGHGVNHKGEFTGPSGIIISANDYEKLLNIQAGLIQIRNLYVAGQIDFDVFNIQRENLEDAMIKIFDKAQKNSPRQKEIDKITAEVNKYRERIKQGEILSAKELRQFVEHKVQLRRLNEATYRENSMMASQLRLDYYNITNLIENKDNLKPYERWQINDFEEVSKIINQLVHYSYGSSVDTTGGKKEGQVGNVAQRKILDRRIKLEKEIQTSGLTPERQAELHRLNYQQFIAVEASAYDFPNRNHEALRNDFLRKALTKSELPYEEFLDYVIKYNFNIEDPKQQELVGEAIEIAKELRKNKEIRGQHLTDKQQRFLNLATQIMRLDTKDLKNVDFSNSKVQIRGFEGTKTAGAKFKDTTFLEGTSFSNAELTTTTNVSFGKDTPKVDPKWITDFTRADLKGAYFIDTKGRFTIFAGANLTNANFLNGDFRDADFTDANLARAQLNSANFQNGNFAGTNLSHTDTSGTNFKDAFFQNAQFTKFNFDETGKPVYNSKTNFTGAVLKNCTGTNANFSTNNFTEAFIEKSEFNASDFSNANLSKAIIISSTFKDSTSFTDANLTDASIINSSFNNTVFFRATMQRANLFGSRFKDCNFSKADLTSANLQGIVSFDSNFSDANLTGANLLDATFYKANFKGTNLEGANLQGADLSTIQIDSSTKLQGAIYDNNTKFPGINNDNEAARAAFAEKHGLVHINQMMLLQKAQQAKLMISQLEKRFNEIVENQGWANGLYDGAKNNADTANKIVDNIVFGPTLGSTSLITGKSTTNIFDKSKGSEAVKSAIAKLKREAQELEMLAKKGYTKANAQKIDEKFKELFGDNMHQIFNTPPEKRMKVLKDYLQDPSKTNEAALKQQVLSDFALMGGKFKDVLLEIDKYITSQNNFGEGCSMAVGIGTLLICTALAGPTGGASLTVAPLVSAGAATGFRASNGKGDGTNYSAGELATGFAAETVAGYITVGLGKYVISKVGGRYIARLATTRLGSTGSRFVVNSFNHAANGAVYSMSYRTTAGVLNGEDFFTAFSEGLNHAQEGAIIGLVFGHTIDGAHKGFQNALSRSRGNTTRLPVELQYARNGHKVPIPEFIRTSNAFKYHSRHYGLDIKIVVDTNLPKGVNAQTHVAEANGYRTTTVRVRPEVAYGLAKGNLQARKIISEEIQGHGNQSIIDPLANGKTMPRQEYLAKRAFQELSVQSATAKRFGKTGKNNALAEVKRLIDSGNYSEALRAARKYGLTTSDLAVFNGDYNANINSTRGRVVQRSNSTVTEEDVDYFLKDADDMDAIEYLGEDAEANSYFKQYQNKFQNRLKQMIENPESSMETVRKAAEYAENKWGTIPDDINGALTKRLISNINNESTSTRDLADSFNLLKKLNGGKIDGTLKHQAAKRINYTVKNCTELDIDEIKCLVDLAEETGISFSRSQQSKLQSLVRQEIDKIGQGLESNSMELETTMSKLRNVQDAAKTLKMPQSEIDREFDSLFNRLARCLTRKTVDTASVDKANEVASRIEKAAKEMGMESSWEKGIKGAGFEIENGKIKITDFTNRDNARFHLIQGGVVISEKPVGTVNFKDVENSVYSVSDKYGRPITRTYKDPKTGQMVTEKIKFISMDQGSGAQQVQGGKRGHSKTVWKKVVPRNGDSGKFERYDNSKIRGLDQDLNPVVTTNNS